MAVFFEKEFMSAVPKVYRDAVMLASDAAEKKGYQIFLIGGVVRDLILKNDIKDIDVAVQGDAIEFAEVLEKDYGCKLVGIQENLRTAKVEFCSGCVIDFASTRQERYLESGRLPVAYDFGCGLKQDILRRDFTINTLALCLTGFQKFKLVDYCGGYEDILNKKIRILHNNSFVDDPSRIIRALKFKVRFGFEIEEKTHSLMQNYLDDVSPVMPLERIKGELKQYFSLDNELLYELFISETAYKLISDNPIEKIDYRNINFMNISKTDVWFIYLVVLIVNSDFSIERLNLTSIEKRTLKEVRELLKNKIEFNNNYEIYKSFNGLAELSMIIYYVITGSNYVLKYLNELKNIKVEINGKDLIMLGFSPSPYFNKIFDIILNEKLSGNLHSKEDEIKFVRENIKKEE